MELISLMVSYLCMLVVVLVSVAFMVLFERKILGYIQIRKGPNKVGYLGIFQSFGDAIKLFIKEQTIPLYSNLILYYFAPVVSLILMLLVWSVLPVTTKFVDYLYGGLFFFCCTSFGVYPLIASGWSSNSNYALLGAIRGIAQTISYEVSMALIFISFIFLIFEFNMIKFYLMQANVWFFVLLFPLFLSWMASILAETNRTPFDFAEGESELVSGFNIEYGSGGFAFLFLAEYGSIIFMSFLTSVVFFGGMGVYPVTGVVGLFFCFWFIWVRGTLPRYRYDKLMYLAWKIFLPFSLLVIVFYYLIGCV